ncbi:MAG: metal ABC transporter permease [Deltaproteobacteria bacterium]|nr:metal ABC transporter permease [Deltaproteobacteria bacterium]
MEMIDFLSYGFIQRALITGFFIALLCSFLGFFLVLRRLSLIGDGLAHVTFGSVAVALFFKTFALYVSIPVVMISALGILRLIEKAKLHGDAAIGIVSSLGIAIGILLASLAGGFNIDLFSYLFGNILAISREEMILSILLSGVVFLVIIFFYHDLLSVTFDEESAKAAGVKTRRINTLLFLLTAVTVVLTMKAVGILLTSALLILPAVTSLQVSKGFKASLLISSLVGVLSVIGGIFISFWLNLPTGATIVLFNFFIFMLVFAHRRYNIKKRRLL